MANHYPGKDDPLAKWKVEAYPLLYRLKVDTNFVSWNNNSRDDNMFADAKRLLEMIAALPDIRKAGPGAGLGQ